MAEGMLNALPGVFYTTHVLPACASAANTAYEAICHNPFDANAYVESVSLIPIEAITGDNTNSQNYNIDLVATTEIANKDFPLASDGVRGVALAFTMTGTDAQRTIASGGSLLVEREEVGTQPARIHGAVIRVGWKRI